MVCNNSQKEKHPLKAHAQFAKVCKPPATTTFFTGKPNRLQQQIELKKHHLAQSAALSQVILPFGDVLHDASASLHAAKPP